MTTALVIFSIVLLTLAVFEAVMIYLLGLAVHQQGRALSKYSRELSRSKKKIKFLEDQNDFMQKRLTRTKDQLSDLAMLDLTENGS